MSSIVIADYPGHPCQIQLSRALSRRGIQVCHVYCPDIPTGRGDLAPEAGGAGPEIVAISLGSQIERYRLTRRIRQEIRWGVLLGREVRKREPSAVVLSNLPLLCQLVVVLTRRRHGARVVLWQQDVHSIAIGAVAKRKLGVLGRSVGWLATRLERIPARAAVVILTISPAFRPILAAWGVRSDRVIEFPNWAPVEELPSTARDNEWRQQAGLGGRKVVLYAGTLGLKHDPGVLLRVAEALGEIDRDAVLVVVSEGIGRAHLDAARATRPGLAIMTFDYQPYEALPFVMGAADVLLAVLEEDAGQYSVPSKVLSYLCASRPVLGIIPDVNAAAHTIRAASAGLVIEPDRADTAAIDVALRELLAPARAAAFGEAARAYAEREFDVERKADTFAAAVIGVVDPSDQ